MKRITILAIILICTVTVHAKVINVPGDSATIGSAISAAQDGDTVLLADGIYKGEGNRDLEYLAKSIVLTSVNGPEKTIIDCESAYHDTSPKHYFLKITHAGSSPMIIDGLTIRRTQGVYGAGIYLSEFDTVRISNCNFDHNRVGPYGGRGGAIYIDAEQATIEDCKFDHNIGWEGASIYSKVSKLFINACEFNDNEYGPAIYTEYVDSGSITKSSFKNNWGVYSSIISGNNSNILMLNCTIAYNRMPLILTGWHFQPTIERSILAFNSYSHLVECVEGVPQFVNSNLYGNEGGDWTGCISDQKYINGNFSMDPIFCSEIGNGLQISHLSPCNGINNPHGVLIGAYEPACESDFEYPLPGVISYQPSANHISVVDDDFEIAWVYADISESSQYQYEMEIGSDPDWSDAEVWSSGIVTSSENSVQYGGPALSDHEHYFVRIRLNDGRKWGSWKESEFITHFTPVIHVPGDEPGIQEAIDVSLDGDTVLVDFGTYAEHVNFLGKSILLKSIHGPEKTIITKNLDRLPIVSFNQGEDQRTIIDGFTIQNAHRAPGVFMDSHSSGIVRNCIIQNNQNFKPYGMLKNNGGGLACMHDAVIQSNIIRNNYCDGSGAGIYLGESFTSDVSGNKIYDNNCDAYGAAIYVQLYYELNVNKNIIYNNEGNTTFDVFHGGALKFTHNTLANNLCKNDGAALRIGRFSYGELANNIVAFNRGGYGIGMDGPDASSFAVYECNDVFDNELGNYDQIQPGQNDLALDPMFCDTSAGNFNLQSESPCAPENNSCTSLIGAGLPGCGVALCGDCNSDGQISIGDAVISINHVFSIGIPDETHYYWDTNCDGILSLSDAVVIINYIFNDGHRPCDTDRDEISDCR